MSPLSHDGQRLASVVVLTCGAAEVTAACLDKLTRTAHRPLEVVVICNGRDRAVEAALVGLAPRAAAAGVGFQSFVNETNLGACTGRNQALSQVNGEYIAFIDNDILCEDPLWLTRAIQILRRDPGIGVVGPRLVQATTPDRLECAGYAIDDRGRVIALGAGCSCDAAAFRCVREVQAVGNFVARTRCIRRLGGFDTSFDPFGFENIDLCYRMKSQGLAIVCDGESDLHHLGHVTTGRMESHTGNRILFSKSLLLRRRWGSVFQQERELCERLLSLPNAETEVGI